MTLILGERREWRKNGQAPRRYVDARLRRRTAAADNCDDPVSSAAGRAGKKKTSWQWPRHLGGVACPRVARKRRPRHSPVSDERTTRDSAAATPSGAITHHGGVILEKLGQVCHDRLKLRLGHFVAKHLHEHLGQPRRKKEERLRGRVSVSSLAAWRSGARRNEPHAPRCRG